MRRTIQSVVSSPPADEVAITYQAWIGEAHVPLIRDAVKRSGLSWPQWAEKAIERLEREDDDEIEGLVTSWPRDRKGKRGLSFRMFPGTLVRSQRIAEKHSGTIQAVIAHAFTMHAMAAAISAQS